MTTGELVKLLRQILRLTQEEAAEKSGINRSYFAQIETGSVEPGLTVLRKISKGLQIPLRLLVRDSDSGVEDVIESIHDLIKTIVRERLDSSRAKKRLTASHS